MTPNVLLISLDTLRADVALSGRFDAMNQLGRMGVTFETAISSAPLTPVSHTSVLTGLQPFNHGVRHLLREQLPNEIPTLADSLRQVGYATGAVVACPGLNRWYGLDRGFQLYDDEIPLLADGRDPLHVVDVKVRGTALKRAPIVVERSLAWLADIGDEPFFLFAHFFDAHWPYEPPGDFGPVDNPYEGEVAFMDHHLGLLLRGVESLGYDLSETVIVCFSDHGEDLAGWYPNDHAGDLYPEEEGHGTLLFEATQRVPLWIVAPTAPAGVVRTHQVRLVDVTPTILNLAGVPAIEADGASLVPDFLDGEAPHRPAYFETFFREELAEAQPRFRGLKPLKGVRLDGRLKTIWEHGGDGVWAYDLDADPLERAPLAGPAPVALATA